MNPGFELPFELPEIPDPVFPVQGVNIQDFGAVPDGKTLNTEAFRAAIADCHARGGGMIRVPAGDWLTGPIHLQSNICLHLERDLKITCLWFSPAGRE